MAGETPKTFVYCVQERGRDAFGPIKVGRARDPRQRLDNLQVGNPVQLALYGCIGPFTDTDAARIETEIHMDMSRHRIRGEWFSGIALSFFDEALSGYGCRLESVKLR